MGEGGDRLISASLYMYQRVRPKLSSEHKPRPRIVVGQCWLSWRDLPMHHFVLLPEAFEALLFNTDNYSDELSSHLGASLAIII